METRCFLAQISSIKLHNVALCILCTDILSIYVWFILFRWYSPKLTNFLHGNGCLYWSAAQILDFLLNFDKFLGSVMKSIYSLLSVICTNFDGESNGGVF